MYQSCLNNSDKFLLSLSICDDITNITNDFQSEEDLTNIVPTSVIILFGLIGIAGLLGNGLVVIVVIANPAMRSTTNILILNLAIADLLFVIFTIPFTASDYIYQDWQFGNFWCKFVQYMIFVTCHASVYTLVFMSVDRFFAVVHPISSISLRTESNAVIAIIFAWSIILTSAFPVGITHGEVNFHHHGEQHHHCLFLTEQGYSHIGFQIAFFLSSYLIPLTLISVLYIEMLLRLWRAAPGGKNSAETRKSKKRVTRLVVVVVLAFTIGWCPIQIVLLLKSFKIYNLTRASVTMQILSHGLAYLNSCTNPIFYAYLSENFLKAFKKFICCNPTTQVLPATGTTTGTKTTKTGTTITGPSSNQTENV